ncbi:hypothetical protein NL676_015708 [Syzygium grande]|nr:hypothetical protein NL676_015708 [Syzygium grande]
MVKIPVIDGQQLSPPATALVPMPYGQSPNEQPYPNMYLSIPLLNLIESRRRIFPPVQTRIKPSALPSSFWASKLVAVVLKKGPSVFGSMSRVWALEALIMSVMVGKSLLVVSALGFLGGS